MAVTEERRHRLHQKLDEVVGVDDAATVMELLPPTGWADVARRDDLDRLESSLRREIGHLSTRMDDKFVAVEQRFDAVEQRFAGVDQRMDDRFDAVERRFDDMEHRMDDRFTATEHRIDDRIDGLRTELLAAFRGELVTIVSVQGRQMVVALATVVVGFGGLAVALVQVLT